MSKQLEQAMARVSNIAQAKTKQILDGEKKNFHQREIDRMVADPENKALKAATAKGEERVAAFLASAMDPQDKNHEANYATWKNKHGRDSTTARNTIIEDTCNELGASAYEAEDPNYEARVVSKWKPKADATPEAHHFYEAFKSGLNEKWRNRGYRSDESWVSDFVSKYDLQPNDNLDSHRNLKLKK